jgi:hypothetical protein
MIIVAKPTTRRASTYPSQTTITFTPTSCRCRLLTDHRLIKCGCEGRCAPLLSRLCTVQLIANYIDIVKRQWPFYFGGGGGRIDDGPQAVSLVMEKGFSFWLGQGDAKSSRYLVDLGPYCYSEIATSARTSNIYIYIYIHITTTSEVHRNIIECDTFRNKDG